MGITLAEKSAMREIHVFGELRPALEVWTSFGSGAWGWDDDSASLERRPRASYVAHRCEGGFDVVRTRDMIRVEGPFQSLDAAEDAAAVRRMERKAERFSAKAIMEMARRAECMDEK